MTEKKPVIVYGASGYTGRLVCEYLRELHVPFIAAGRDCARTQAVMDKIPSEQNTKIAEVEHSVKALTKLFDGAKVVSNMVGPFSKYGPEVAEACLAAGCHYTDTTGEQDWVLDAKTRWGQKFAAKGLLLSPGVAQMYTTGEIAAICLETPGVDTLDILVLWKGFPTYASTQTIFAILRAKWYYLEQNKLVEWAQNTHFDVNVPGQHAHALVTPWTGTSHPVWFKDDPRVANCKALGGVFAREIMEESSRPKKCSRSRSNPCLPMSSKPSSPTSRLQSLKAGMPPRENPRVNISLNSVYGSGPLARVHCVIHGVSNYKQTGLLQAHAAYSLLQSPPKKTGFASACQAFGHRELLGVLKSFGLVMDPMVTAHH